MQKNIGNLPLISAVICSKDGHDRIARAIKSVLTQDYPNIELIVVDDGSSINLQPITSSFQDSRISFFRFEHNRGLHAARAFALEQARGEFVALLDDDDEWLPDKLSRQLPLLLESPKVGLVCGGAIDIYPDGTRMNRLPPSHQITHDQEIVNEYTIASSVVFRKASYVEVGGFDGTLRRCGDWECWIRLSKKYEIKAVMHPVVITHMGQGSLQRSKDINMFDRDRLKVVQKYETELRNLGRWDDALYYHLHSLGIRYLRAKDFDNARVHLLKALSHKFNAYSFFALLLSLFKVGDTVKLRQLSRTFKQMLK